MCGILTTKQETDKRRPFSNLFAAKNSTRSPSFFNLMITHLQCQGNSKDAKQRCQNTLKEEYLPCLAHRINTTVEHSCEASDVISGMFDTLEMIYVFFTSSTKCYMVFRQKSIVAVWASFDGIIAALEKEVESEDAKTKVKAKNLLAAVKCFKFIAALMFMRNVMSKTKILTKQVQTVELNVVDALEALDATINTLKYLREKAEDINLQIEAAVVFSAQHGVNAESEFAKHHRKRVAPQN